MYVTANVTYQTLICHLNFSLTFQKYHLFLNNNNFSIFNFLTRIEALFIHLKKIL